MKERKTQTREPRLDDVMRVEFVPWDPKVDWVDLVANLAVKLWLIQRKQESERRERERKEAL